ncbi:MAG TPA: cellulase family glycosylhydrolase [Leptospiraceae bacterium]|nr:cellulase family glycosylhydrolase [Leptospiraceae bacterium]HMW03942.1 cellulase family glycosylhydrolase [Leptospiraceae bacterium]HMY29922.1 cellulase family glycosylhydrolase [Leptospiraceae bacterium]HMZ67124.1 cellulase family glycosylhydrolase [Leptospiraceae bacterium]HNA08262.1 cellulase family glycosylhydrolase [Leptospiraceae bacterium]
MDRLTSKNGFFVNKSGAVVLLRGVNLAGSSKVPLVPDGTTFLNQNESFQNHRNVSFVGRPFLEEEANEHFNRLRKWGFNFLRFIVTWEAIEHSGPGVYDDEYLEYIVRMVKLAEKKGFYLFIDPHQDVWSRFTGGDGAPGWTLDAVGIDIMKIKDADMAYIHHVQGKDYKKMIWPQNYNKYPTATLFTLFFGGNIFAQNLKIDGSNIQDYLQNHFIKSIVRLAKKISKFKNVIGFGSLNEPSPGFIGRKNLTDFVGLGNGVLNISTPFQEMYCSEGVPCNIDTKFLLGSIGVTVGKHVMNPNGISIWKKGHICVWRKHGVWNYDPNGAPMLLKSDYFAKVGGRNVDFFSDFMKPFVKNFKTAIQKVNKQFFVFIESEPTKLELKWDEKEKKGFAPVVNATHWYDGILLFTKRHFDWLGVHSFKMKIAFGRDSVQEMYNDSIASIKNMSLVDMNQCPTVIGETGIPMDLEGANAYKTQDYSKQIYALDSIFKAIEKNLVNVAIWNYTPDNTHKLGDCWNGEDLSIYSKDTPKQVCPDGGRGTKAFSRPYPILTEGNPVSLYFDISKGLFKYSFRRGDFEKGSCVIYIPDVHYDTGLKVLVNAGTYTYKKEKNLLYFQGETGVDLYGITILRA